MTKSNAIILYVFLIFSFWLAFHTFSYDPTNRSLLVGQKVWSDFGQHIPMIRSFSIGANRDLRKFPEFPLFPGEPMRYHFLFYLFAGILERLGVRIDWAMNIPSAIGMFLLLTAIFFVAEKLFKDTRVNILSVLFFLFNGSLSFVRYFQAHGISLSSLATIVQVNEFPSFAPWGKGDITAFWNLNIYTNQRHLALAFGIALLFLYTVLRLEKKSAHKQIPFAVFFGILFGLFPFFHPPTLLMIAVFEALYYVLFPHLRKFLLTSSGITALIVAPQLFLIRGTKFVGWYPGYLIHDSLNPLHVLSYWWQNLGLHLILIPLGFLLAPKKVRAFFFPILAIFVLAHLFRFSVEVAANHKFFNFALILGNIISAYAVVRVWTLIKVVKIVKIIIVICLFVALTFSGVIDFFVVANDRLGTIPDIGTNITATWIAQHTPRDVVFLNSSFLYHPASIAGRKIFLGWPYFAWSEGYDTDTRLAEMKRMYAPANRSELCRDLIAHHISYVTFQDRGGAEELKFQESAFQTFPIAVATGKEGYRIYDVRGCR